MVHNQISVKLINFIPYASIVALVNPSILKPFWIQPPLALELDNDDNLAISCNPTVRMTNKILAWRTARKNPLYQNAWQ